ncbi:MAG: ABC transporter substrate-binding protein [Alphaproteobacteria bacterium]|nr:ABC transporter substrate-binding protein [Alphaproteobacteria bacterium]
MALLRSLALALAALALPALAGAQSFVEPPSLAAEVAAGRLPPVDRRLPRDPLVHAPGGGFEPGRHGGELRVIMGRSQDVRMMAVYGYARLVGYSPRLELEPDILAGVDIVEDRIFTLRLREGHRWSDGHPFTSEDFRYWWEDVAGNRQVSPSGPPQVMLVEGKPPAVSFPDARTVRFAWDGPNPGFLPALAGASPLYIYRPAHYLRQFHERYADRARLDERVRAERMRGWSQLHNRLDNMYRNDNPDLPTLEPWVLATRPPAERFVFQRNPYFHRVDANGLQLPYADRVAMAIADAKLIPLKVNAGEADLQARGLAFNNYTFLRQAAREGKFDVRLWNTAKGAQLALYPNLSAEDPAWRRLNRDPRFRRALSLAINRREINQVVYFGLALEGHNTVLPSSALFDPRLRAAPFDLAEANRLLDEIGLRRQRPRGLRMLPDGRPLEITVETAGEDTEQTDVLQLVHDSWLEAGIKLFIKPSQREYFRNRVFSGKSVMTIWSGVENGLAGPSTNPEEFVPTSQQQLQWPRWGQHAETAGRSGEAVDDPAALELVALEHAWRKSTSELERLRAWQRVLEIHAEQVFTIGLVANVRQPVVVSRRLRNVPDIGVYNWDPGAFFGVYRPDSFWFGEPRAAAALRRE